MISIKDLNENPQIFLDALVYAVKTSTPEERKQAQEIGKKMVPILGEYSYRAGMRAIVEIGLVLMHSMVLSNESDH